MEISGPAFYNLTPLPLPGLFLENVASSRWFHLAKQNLQRLSSRGTNHGVEGRRRAA